MEKSLLPELKTNLFLETEEQWLSVVRKSLP